MSIDTAPSGPESFTEFVTVTVADQPFGLPISRVHDVFIPDRLTRVPLAPVEVAGVLNLRGRIVTAIDMRCRLGLPAQIGGRAMAVGIELGDESYALLVDAVGEVIKLEDATLEGNPVNLDQELSEVSLGVHRLEGRLLVILDVDRVLDVGGDAAAA